MAIKSRGSVVSEALEGRRLMSVGVIAANGAVRMETNLGRMTFLLTPEVTPITVVNFLRYVDQGLYNNTIIHRTAPLENPTNDIIQGGGYRQASGFPHVTTFDPIVNEFNNLKPVGSANKVNVRGTIAMAKTSDPNSATSQWFVNVADNSEALDVTSNSGGFTTFGTVIGGGMHTVDAIAGLPRSDKSNLNPAFGELPVIESAVGEQAVVVASATAERVLPVTLDGSTKVVQWTDEKGAVGTISLGGGGTADLTFVGGNDLKFTEQGDKVVVSGKGIELATVAAHGTGAGSVLAITSRGGRQGARVGDISADGALKEIDAKTVWLDGDLNVAGNVGKVEFAETNRSTLSVQGSGGGLVVRVGKAIDTSVNTTMGVKELTVGKWTEEGALPANVVAAGVGKMTVGGNFSAGVTSSGGVGSVVVKGTLGRAGGVGSGVWNVQGAAGDVRANAVKGWDLSAGSVGNVTATGAMESSSVRAVGSVGAVSARSMEGSRVSAGGQGSGGGGFGDAGASVGKVSLRGTFADSRIEGPRVGTVRLGRVVTSNGGTGFGVTAAAARGIERLDAVVGGKGVSLRNMNGVDQVEGYFAQRKIEEGDFEVRFV